MKNIIVLIAFTLTISSSVLAQDKPKGLKENEQAPDFTAKDQAGQTIHLKSLLTKSAVVLVFYRGQWCPYCNKALKSLEDSLKLITSKGGVVLAVSPEKPDNIIKTIEKTKASYSVLYDDGLKIMKNYDVVYRVDSLTISKYKTYGIDFNIANGAGNGENLPVPAVYVINKNGKIVYRHFDPDFRKRANIREIASHL